MSIFSYVTITVEETGESYDSLTDWGLYLSNNNYIGSPEEQTDFINIKGKNGLLDITEALTGHRSYSSREIRIEFGGVKDAKRWDDAMSDFRNKIDGKIIRVIFSNQFDYFWRGRCHLEDFDRMCGLGTFTLSIPYADPYKYSVETFNEDWLWSPFDFETDEVHYKTTHNITTQETVVIPAGKRPVVPVVTVTELNTTLTVQKGNNGRIIRLSMGANELPQIMVNGPEETTLIFKGNATFEVNFRGASL